MSDTTEPADDSMRTLTESEVADEHLADWRMLIDRLHASFDTTDFASAVSLVDDRSAPAYWVLADPQGNRACLTTWQGRDAL